MKNIFVIFKKEITDTLRDRRTVMMMIVLPIMLIFLMVNLITTLSIRQHRKAQEKVLDVGLITNGNAGDFRSKLLERGDMKVKEDIEASKIEDLIRDKKLDFAVVFEKDFDLKINEKGSGGVVVYYKASRENNIAKRRIEGALNDYKETLLSGRLEALELDQAFVTPLEINEKDLSTQKEKLGEVVGGFVPYIFVIFCFMGAMYPAIDLAAGEKERATIETLLTSPASRFQIVLGKFMVVALSGIISAAISILALYMSVRASREIPQQALDSLLRIVELKSIGLLFSLLIPLCVFFAALLLTFSIFARSYKEAQSIIAPLNIVVIVPVMIGLFPGFKLNALTALIPIFNVSLATKEIISGTIQTGLLLEVYLSLIVLATVSLLFCSWWFKREEVIFRGI
jgi:sodium transport system permease protein